MRAAKAVEAAHAALEEAYAMQANTHGALDALRVVRHLCMHGWAGRLELGARRDVMLVQNLQEVTVRLKFARGAQTQAQLRFRAAEEAAREAKARRRVEARLLPLAEPMAATLTAPPLHRLTCLQARMSRWENEMVRRVTEAPRAELLVEIVRDLVAENEARLEEARARFVRGGAFSPSTR